MKNYCGLSKNCNQTTSCRGVLSARLGKKKELTTDREAMDGESLARSRAESP